MSGRCFRRCAGGRRFWCRAGFAAVFVLTFAATFGASSWAKSPTVEDYLQAEPDTKLVPAGQLKIDGHRMECGTRPSILNDKLDDYAAAYPGFLIINMKLFNTVKSTPVKLWIYSHECGHQFRGPDEEMADCFAVQRGRRQKWLTPEGLDEVCKFMSPAKGDSMHFSGPKRCDAMRRCYADPEVK